MRLLWAFNFQSVKDPATMQSVHVDLENFSSVRNLACCVLLLKYLTCLSYFQDITLAPRPFRCSIVPRSAQHIRVVQSAFLDATDTFKRFEDELTVGEKKNLATSRRRNTLAE